MSVVVRKMINVLLAFTLVLLPLQVVHAGQRHDCESPDVISSDSHAHKTGGGRHLHEALSNMRTDKFCSYCYYQDSCGDNNSCQCHVVANLFSFSSGLIAQVDNIFIVSVNYYLSYLEYSSIPLLRPPII